MKAAVLERFGGPEELKIQEVPVPDIEEYEVLVRLAYAGIGQWDSFEREGGYDQLWERQSSFPYILGSEGAGYIHAIGEKVEHLQVGDRVYATGFLNPKGGFYAEYAAIDAAFVSKIPSFMSLQEASVVSGVGLTALRGLEDTLHIRKGETLLVFGASGGVGHVAVQLAKQMGTRVIAVASGPDGVAAVKELGIDSVLDGRKDNVVEKVQRVVPEGLDAALLTAGGEVADQLVSCVRSGGRIAYPNGVYPPPASDRHKEVTGYYGNPDPDIIQRFQERINQGIHAHVDRVYPLDQAAEAHRALNNHYVGKLCLQISFKFHLSKETNKTGCGRQPVFLHTALPFSLRKRYNKATYSEAGRSG